MHVHVALTPADFPGLVLAGSAAVVVDVLRATTTVVAACAAGCAAVVPVADPGAARARAASFSTAEVLLAGEQGGEPIPGFHLGNSPLEYVPERVAGRVVILTTTNGTAAMLLAREAGAAATAALTNVGAAAAWVLEQGRDLVVLCAGEQGALSLEDVVCAGLLAGRVAAGSRSVEVSDAAVVAMKVGEHYVACLERLGEESAWARWLTQMGRAADIVACLRLDTSGVVPIFQNGAIRPGGPRALAGAAGAASSNRGAERSR